MAEVVSITHCHLQDEGVLEYVLLQPHIECRSYNTIIYHLLTESGLSCPSTGKGKPAPELCHEQVCICTKYTRPASFFTVLPEAKTSRALAWLRWLPLTEDHSSASRAIKYHPSCHLFWFHTLPLIWTVGAWFVTQSAFPSQPAQCLPCALLWAF